MDFFSDFSLDLLSFNLLSFDFDLESWFIIGGGIFWGGGCGCGLFGAGGWLWAGGWLFTGGLLAGGLLLTGWFGLLSYPQANQENPYKISSIINTPITITHHGQAPGKR